MKYLIKNGRIINPINAFDEVADIMIEDGKITEINKNIESREAQIIDAGGLLVTPGLIDIHVHFRDPGYIEKESIETGIDAAVAGGFTAVVNMPNTLPAIDNIKMLDYVEQKVKNHGIATVYSACSISQGNEGKAIVNMKELISHGAVTFLDDGGAIKSTDLLYEGFQKAAELGVTISSNDKKSYFTIAGSINLGDASRQLGDIGIPAVAEELSIAQNILFAENTGAKLHIQGVSTARSIQLVREAKARGVKVTAEVNPHHFSLTDNDAIEKGSLVKVSPPLRTKKDIAAVMQGLKDSTIDVIATDHAPHTSEEKALGLQGAPFGILGLETCVGLIFTNLVNTGELSINEAIRKITVNAANVMNLDEGKLEIGGDANITIIDPDLEWVVDEEEFKSKSKNSPFIGDKLKGKVVKTIYKGEIVYKYEGK